MAYETGGRDIMKKVVYEGRGQEPPKDPGYETGGFTIVQDIQKGHKDRPAGQNGYDIVKKLVGKS